MSDESNNSAVPVGQIPLSNSKYCFGCGKQLHWSAGACPNCGAQQGQLFRRGFKIQPQTWAKLYFNADGRIGRQQWWISHLLLLTPLFILAFVAALTNNDQGSANILPETLLGFVSIVWFICYVWSSICLNAKRWHDRDYSGWMQLVAIIPLIGIWVLIENGFLRGTDGPNRFGEIPLA